MPGTANTTQGFLQSGVKWHNTSGLLLGKGSDSSGVSQAGPRKIQPRQGDIGFRGLGLRVGSPVKGATYNKSPYIAHIPSLPTVP